MSLVSLPYAFQKEGKVFDFITFRNQIASDIPSDISFLTFFASFDNSDCVFLNLLPHLISSSKSEAIYSLKCSAIFSC